MNYNLLYSKDFLQDLKNQYVNNIINNNFYHASHEVMALQHYKNLIGPYIIKNMNGTKKDDNGNLIVDDDGNVINFDDAQYNYIDHFPNNKAPNKYAICYSLADLRYHEGYKNAQSVKWTVTYKNKTYTIDPDGLIYAVSSDGSEFLVISYGNHAGFNPFWNDEDLYFHSLQILNTLPQDLQGASSGPIVYHYKDGDNYYDTDAIFPISSNEDDRCHVSYLLGKYILQIETYSDSDIDNYIAVKNTEHDTKYYKMANPQYTFNYMFLDKNNHEVSLPILTNSRVQVSANENNTSIKSFITFTLNILTGSKTDVLSYLTSLKIRIF